MTFGPEKVQDRLTRKPPPGRLLQHTPRRLPLQGKDFWGQKEILFLFLANLRCIVKILATAFPGMQKHLIANQTMKEFCESELCDLKFGCTWQIARCRISSMPPFNWHFLPPTVSCHFFSPPSKKWHWTDNSTAAFCQRHFHLWMLPFALHAMLVLPFNLCVLNGVSCRAKLSVF